jgi:hypothetical protein
LYHTTEYSKLIFQQRFGWTILENKEKFESDMSKENNALDKNALQKEK